MAFYSFLMPDYDWLGTSRAAESHEAWDSNPKRGSEHHRRNVEQIRPTRTVGRTHLISLIDLNQPVFCETNRATL